jgi:hypothetical protein
MMAGRGGGGRGSAGGRGGFQVNEGDWPCPNPGWVFGLELFIFLVLN